MEEYDNWNEVKKETVKTKMRLTIKPRDIFWAKIGQNIGHEEFGKGKNFLSKKRLLNKIATVNKDDFNIITKKLKRLIDPT